MHRLATTLMILVGILAGVGSTAEAAVPGKPFTETGCEERSDAIARLYAAGLGRQPDQEGFEWWLGEYMAGRWLLPRAASFFTTSPEFRASYGDVDDAEFVRQLYRNMLGREGDDEGIAFWVREMNAGMSRGTVLLRFSESTENIARTGTTTPIEGPFGEGASGPWACGVPINRVATPAPPTEPAPTQPEGCDPNYSPCVPIARDVDCADGDGNGPAYVRGPVRIIGEDIYDLDGDGDGIGCEQRSA